MTTFSAYPPIAKSAQDWRAAVEGVPSTRQTGHTTFGNYDPPAYSFQRIRELLQGAGHPSPTPLIPKGFEGYDDEHYSLQKIRSLLGLPDIPVPRTFGNFDPPAASLQAIRSFFTGTNTRTPGVPGTFGNYDDPAYSLSVIAHVLDVAGETVTLSGNEITDAVRAAGLEGDGLVAPAGMGIWRPTQNVLSNGGFQTNTTGWSTGANNTITRVSAASEGIPSLFGSHVLKATSGVGGGTTLAQFFPISLTAAQYASGPWIYIPANWDGGAITVNQVLFTGGSIVAGVFDMTKLDQWQRATPPGLLTPDSGDLSGGFPLITRAAPGPTSGRFVYIDGAQDELQSIATPYKETNGATASRPAARVRMPVTGLTPSLGSVAVRYRPGFANTQISTGFAVLWQWLDDANNRLVLRYDHTNNRFSFIRQAAGSGAEITVANTFSADAARTVAARWTATAISLSINGAAFVDVANADVPALSATEADIGSNAGAASWQDGRTMWAAAGASDLDSAAALALLSDQPSVAEIGIAMGPADPAFFWPAVDANAWRFA